jgi:gamma-glutamyltranspeptidase/glutathione hydrolase
MIEASKVAIADRKDYYGDPDFSKVPYDILVSKPYAKRIAEKIDMKKATPIEVLRPENLVKELGGLSSSGEGVTSNIVSVSNIEGATTNLAVIDKDYNVCVITQTNGSAFGSNHIVPGTGFILCNEGQFFELESKANRPEAGKRVENEMGPAVVLKDGKFFVSIGSPGGTQIPQAIAKVLMLMIDHGLRIQEAINAPRVRYVGGSVTGLEEGIPWEVREKLWQMGHDLTVATSFCGTGGVLVVPGTGVMEGGAEPSRNDFAVAW